MTFSPESKKYEFGPIFQNLNLQKILRTQDFWKCQYFQIFGFWGMRFLFLRWFIVKNWKTTFWTKFMENIIFYFFRTFPVKNKKYIFPQNPKFHRFGPIFHILTFRKMWDFWAGEFFEILWDHEFFCELKTYYRR